MKGADWQIPSAACEQILEGIGFFFWGGAGAKLLIPSPVVCPKPQDRDESLQVEVDIP